MKCFTHSMNVKYFTLVLAATGLGTSAFGQEYDFFGVSDMGDNIVVSGKFSAADVDGDRVLEWPNDPLELTLLDLTAIRPGIIRPEIIMHWSRSGDSSGDASLNDFTFQKIGNSGLWSMDAEVHTNELINGNEIRTDAILAVVNSGNTLSNRFTADLMSTNGPDSVQGIGSGPIMITEKLSRPGTKFNFGMTFGDDGSSFGGGTLLGTFILDDIDDFNIEDLNTIRTQISSSEAMFVDRAGQVSRWEFEQGFSNPPIPGAQAADLEIQYRCGSPDIYCQASIDGHGSWIDIKSYSWGIDASATGPLDITELAAMQVMEGTAMFDLPIESAFFELADVVPRYPGDFDADDDSDGADFLVLQRNMDLIGNATRRQGDANGDRDINELDMLIWQSEFGNAAAPTIQRIAGVPEPSTWLLSCLAGAYALQLRHDRNRRLRE